MADSVTAQSTRSRKTKALLAGGLVLGVGAAATLAAWTDEEWVSGLFGAGTFNIEGSVDGETWAEHPTSGGAASLEFSTGFNNLAPNTTVAAPFSVRLDAPTTYGASVLLTSASVTGTNPTALTYALVQVDDVDSCTSAATATTLIPAGTPLTSAADAVPFVLAAGEEDEPGDAVTLCFQVTAGAGLQQGQQNNATWQFLGTSTE